MSDDGKIYALVVFGVTVKQFRNKEIADQWREDLIEDPQLFCQVKPWEPEPYMMPYVAVEDDTQA